MFSIHRLNRRPAILDTAAAVAGDAQQVVVRARFLFIMRHWMLHPASGAPSAHA
jgi:hypothetical protein